MNLLAKRLGQLAMLAVALFFFSCDDLSSIGIENPTSKFDVRYIEIPLGSSVIRMDTLRTGYHPDPNSLMVGSYIDTVFGTTEARFFTAIYPSLFELQNNPVYNDTITLYLVYDYYVYGSSAATEQSINVYKIDSELGNPWRKNSRSTGVFDSTKVLGTKSFTIDPAKFATDKAAGAAPDTIEIPLSKEFGKEIFDELVKFKAPDPKAADTTKQRIYKQFADAFYKVVHGIAVVPQSGDKIYRFDAARSFIGIRWGNATKAYYKDPYRLIMTGGFSQIKSSGAQFGIVNSQTDHYPDNDNRYVQSGTGVFTKLDFSPIYNFIDTVPHAIVSEAQVVITGVKSSQFAPPTEFAFRILDANNREVFFDSTSNFTDYLSYGGYLNADGPIIKPAISWPIVLQPDHALYFASDLGSAAKGSALYYNSEQKTYSGYVTMMTQQLLINRNGRTKYSSVVLYPTAPKASVSVNRVVFPADNIVMKIHYTIPKNITQ